MRDFNNVSSCETHPVAKWKVNYYIYYTTLDRIRPRTILANRTRAVSSFLDSHPLALYNQLLKHVC